VFFKGDSGIGKTWVVTNVLDIFSEEDVWMLGGLSPTALVHDYGTLMGKDGVEIDPSLKPSFKAIKDELQGELREGEKVNAVAVKREFFKRLKEWNDKLKDSFYVVDLHKKLLVFLEAPHIETFNKLRPILSHDKEEISYRFTDKDKSGGLRTSHVKICGWPATMFCTTDKTWLEDLATRSLTITPRITEKKLRAACELVGADAAYPRTMFNGANREKLFKISAVEGLRKEISNLAVAVPYGHEIGHNVPLYRPRVMRDLNHIVSYIQLNALVNHHNRPKITGLEKTLVLATYEDFVQVMTYFLYCEESTVTGLNAHILEVFHKAMEPLQTFDYDGLVLKCQEVLRYPLSRSTLYVYVRELSNIGWVDDEPNPEDKRKRIIRIIKDKQNLLSYLILEFPSFFKLENFKAFLNNVKKLSQQSHISLNDISCENWENDVETLFNEHYVKLSENLRLKIEGYTNDIISQNRTALPKTLDGFADNSNIRQSKIIREGELKCCFCDLPVKHMEAYSFHNGLPCHVDCLKQVGVKQENPPT